MSNNQYFSNSTDRSLQDDFDRLTARAIRVIGADRIWKLDSARIRQFNLALGSIQAKNTSIEAIADYELSAAFETVIKEGSLAIHILAPNNDPRALSLAA